MVGVGRRSNIYILLIRNFFVACAIEVFIVLGTNLQLIILWHPSFLDTVELANIPRIISFFVIICVVPIASEVSRVDFFKVAFRYRYLIGALLLLGCVAFEISGSSIACMAKVMPMTPHDSDGVIWGIPRYIRADEWQKSTPMALSQFSANPQFPYFSELLRARPTDNFLSYGQPVKDIGEIFRPFHWGYLFLGEEKGLAFYWYGRLILLFLITFDFCMQLTNGDYNASFIGALLISFAPVIQWWFAINGLVEMLISGEVAIILTQKYMHTDQTKKKIIYLTGFVICAGSYALTMYPAWQIPFFYIFLVIFIWTICLNFKKEWFSPLKDGLLISVFLILLCILLLHIFLKSKPFIELMLNTTYPGNRVYETSKGGYKVFQYLMNIFLPFDEKNVFVNVCETAVFFDFFPLGIIGAFLLCITDKKTKSLFVPLLFLQSIYFVLILCPLPEWIYRITLVKYTTWKRLQICIGYINVLLIVASLPRLQNISLRYKVGMLVCSSLYAYFGIKHIYFITRSQQIICFMLFLICSTLILFQKYVAVFIISVVVSTSCLVNPVQKGLDVIYENPLTKQISEIARNNRGSWITEHVYTDVFNLPVIAGAPTINSINMYPNLELWHKLDETLVYEDIYNRQAHIGIDLKNIGNTSFHLEGASAFMAYINVNDLKKMDVKYILTTRTLENFSNQNISFLQVSAIDNYYIYEVVYKRGEGT